MRHAPTTPHRHSVLPSYAPSGYPLQCFWRNVHRHSAADDWRWRNLRERNASRQKHFRSYPSRDTRTVAVTVIVGTTTADNSLFTVLRPCRGVGNVVDRPSTGLPPLSGRFFDGAVACSPLSRQEQQLGRTMRFRFPPDPGKGQSSVGSDASKRRKSPGRGGTP